MKTLGFDRDYGNVYIKWCHGRDISVRIKSSYSLDDVWNAIYDSIYNEGYENGKTAKSREIKNALNLDTND